MAECVAEGVWLGVCGLHLVVHQQLRPLEVPRGHPHIVLLARVVELGQSPVNQSQLKQKTQQEISWQRPHRRSAGRQHHRRSASRQHHWRSTTPQEVSRQTTPQEVSRQTTALSVLLVPPQSNQPQPGTTKGNAYILPPFTCAVWCVTAYYLVLVVNHNIMGLDVTVHDAHAVAVVQCFQELMEIKPDVHVAKLLIEILCGGRGRSSLQCGMLSWMQ